MLNFLTGINFPATTAILISPSQEFMKELKKKQLRESVKDALIQVVGNCQIEKPSRKTERLIEKTSRRLSKELKDELKRQAKRMVKAGKAIPNRESVAA